jgi:hypothetical protein
MTSTEPESLNTMYTFDRSYHSTHCSLPMCTHVTHYTHHHPAHPCLPTEDDPIEGQRPVIGIMYVYFSRCLSGVKSFNRTTIDRESTSTFLVYSLYRHHVIKRFPLKGDLASFLSNQHFIVIVSTLLAAPVVELIAVKSTTYPPTLHILSASSFTTLFTVPLVSLLPFNKRKTITNSNILQSELHSVFAFSHCLLAYASPAPHPHAHPPNTHRPTPD